MPEYDGSIFNPPAPVAYVALENPENNLKIENVPMLLDTGSDATLIPQFIVEKLQLSLSNSRIYETEAFNGATGHSPVVRVKMSFLEKNFRGDFLTVAQECGIIGRNILNQRTLRFDGKNFRSRRTPNKTALF